MVNQYLVCKLIILFTHGRMDSGRFDDFINSIIIDRKDKLEGLISILYI